MTDHHAMSKSCCKLLLKPGHNKLIKCLVCREKREDDCIDCNRPYSKIDSVARKYSGYPSCREGNMMICKECTARRAENVSLHAIDQSFEIWCWVEAGLFENLVRSRTSSFQKSLCIWELACKCLICQVIIEAKLFQPASSVAAAPKGSQDYPCCCTS